MLEQIKQCTLRKRDDVKEEKDEEDKSENYDDDTKDPDESTTMEAAENKKKDEEDKSENYDDDTKDPDESTTMEAAENEALQTTISNIICTIHLHRNYWIGCNDHRRDWRRTCKECTLTIVTPVVVSAISSKCLLSSSSYLHEVRTKVRGNNTLIKDI
ncbi:hypothetical protein EWB00_010368 [Schistosoma japonicum]|uniref:Uncharacterized protein n=1 Tax=Schistosoma japonicum TaxID=6182 RepID=A0A4Z2CLD5_SCHJA|nr:hypothetical protein EWB00_010368 [Schistosoma japonicum]